MREPPGNADDDSIVAPAPHAPNGTASGQPCVLVDIAEAALESVRPAATIHRSSDNLRATSRRVVMRTPGRFAPLWMLFASALALAAPPAKPPKADIPPPPGLNDPGVSTPAAAAAADAATPATSAADPLAPLPKPDTRIVRDKAARDAAATSERVAASDVTTRTQGTDTVEEYRQNGHVWMIRIVPQNGGPSQTFMDTNGNGRLTNDNQQGPVSPVYFSLYEWN
jgi:hypothetical protein